MAYKHVDNIVIENARIIFKNFSGKEGRFNREGDRNFCVVIDDPDMANKLKADGWNIKAVAPRDPAEEPLNYIPVAVSFRYNPPRVFMRTGKTQVQLTEETIGSLDNAYIETADVAIRPYNWEVSGNHGIKGYLKTLYVTIEKDEFEDKYSTPSIAPNDISEEEVPF
jgi:hypothetical protein